MKNFLIVFPCLCLASMLQKDSAILEPSYGLRDRTFFLEQTPTGPYETCPGPMEPFIDVLPTNSAVGPSTGPFAPLFPGGKLWVGLYKCLGRLWVVWSQSPDGAGSVSGELSQGRLGQAVIARTSPSVDLTNLPLLWLQKGITWENDEGNQARLQLTFPSAVSVTPITKKINDYLFPNPTFSRTDNVDLFQYFGEVEYKVRLTPTGVISDPFSDAGLSSAQFLNRNRLYNSIPLYSAAVALDSNNGFLNSDTKQVYRTSLSDDFIVERPNKPTLTLIPKGTDVLVKKYLLSEPLNYQTLAKAIIEIQSYKAFQFRGGHRNIRQAYGYWIQPLMGTIELGLATEYAEDTLEELLGGGAAIDGRVCDKSCYKLVQSDIVRGIKFVQESGLTQGDIKTDNILVHWQKFNAVSYVAQLHDFDSARFLVWDSQLQFPTQFTDTPEIKSTEVLIDTIASITKKDPLPSSSGSSGSSDPNSPQQPPPRKYTSLLQRTSQVNANPLNILLSELQSRNFVNTASTSLTSIQNQPFISTRIDTYQIGLVFLSIALQVADGVLGAAATKIAKLEIAHFSGDYIVPGGSYLVWNENQPPTQLDTTTQPSACTGLGRSVTVRLPPFNSFSRLWAFIPINDMNDASFACLRYGEQIKILNLENNNYLDTCNTTQCISPGYSVQTFPTIYRAPGTGTGTWIIEGSDVETCIKPETKGTLIKSIYDSGSYLETCGSGVQTYGTKLRAQGSTWRLSVASKPLAQPLANYLATFETRQAILSDPKLQQLEQPFLFSFLVQHILDATSVISAWPDFKYALTLMHPDPSRRPDMLDLSNTFLG